MKIFFGLGNPGSDYASTRHNAGFLFLDQLQQHLSLPAFAHHARFRADITSGIHPDLGKILLAKPLLFMNRSGEVVRQIVDYYKTPLHDIMIAHDDLDIEIGKYKISSNMRAAGHNGIQSIITSIGTQDFLRIRIGVEAFGGRINRGEISGEKFVLQKFTDEELSLLEDVLSQIMSEITSRTSPDQKNNPL